MPNPYSAALGRASRVPAKKKPTPSHLRSKKQEREIAARLVPRSGAGEIKGDVRVRGVLRIECKTTMHRSFTVTLDMVRKIEEAAVSAGEMPAIVIEFNNGAGKRIAEVAVVPTYVLNELER